MSPAEPRFKETDGRIAVADEDVPEVTEETMPATPERLQDWTAQQLYDAIWEAGDDWANTKAFGELRRRLLRWNGKRLINTGHFIPHVHFRIRRRG